MNLPYEKFYKADKAILNLFIPDILWANVPKNGGHILDCWSSKTNNFKIATILFVERHTRKVHAKFQVSTMYGVRINHDLKFTCLCPIVIYTDSASGGPEQMMYIRFI